MKKALYVPKTAHTRIPAVSPHIALYELVWPDVFPSIGSSPVRVVGQFGTLGQYDQVAESLYCFALRKVTSPWRRET